MSNETTDNFWKAWADKSDEIPTAIEYRLYYNAAGNPLFFSTEKPPGQYIIVDKEFYLHSPAHFCVKNNKLVILEHNILTKLIPAENGTPCSPHDVCIIVDELEPHIRWEKKT